VPPPEAPVNGCVILWGFARHDGAGPEGQLMELSEANPTASNSSHLDLFARHGYNARGSLRSDATYCRSRLLL
jgi:hypothetical protein